MTQHPQLPTVMARIETPDKRDRPLVEHEANNLLHAGFTVADAVYYLRAMEEVSPDLDEETALARFARLNAKYNRNVR